MKIRKGRTPNLDNLIENILKDKTEVDLLLVQHKEPKHILVGECKFTKIYKHDEYAKDIVKLRNFSVALQKTKGAKEDLGLPVNYPIVPTLFSIFAGRIFREEDDVLKTTFSPVTTGKFKDWVINFKYKYDGIR